jgi:polar amino acid transport system substrate-binding protein
MFSKRLSSKKSRMAIFCSAVMIGASTIFIGVSPAASDTKAEIDYDFFTALGWTPIQGSLPNLACRDGSYAKAVASGIKLGVYNAAPYMYTENGKLTGIDYDINVAVLKFIGIKKITNVMLQWPAMIPALVSKRIDVIAGDIHENAGRLKTIAFTTPAWWYGTVLGVNKDNPKNIKTWADLQKSGVKVGAITGSYTAEYLAKLTPKVALTLWESSEIEFQGLLAQKVDVLVEDGPKIGAFNSSNPKTAIKILSVGTNPPAEFQDTDAKFAMRPADCTLIGAYSRALAELRDHGIITAILKKYGLGDGDNLFMPAYKP